MTTATPLSQEKWSWEPRFSIDILPIVSKEDKFAPLTNLSLVKGLDFNKLATLWMEVHKGQHHIRFPESKETFFQWNLRKVWLNYDSNWSDNTKIADSWVLYFQVAKITVFGNTAFLKTREGRFYHGDIDKYLQGGLTNLCYIDASKIESLKVDLKKQIPFSRENGILNIPVKSKIHNIAADSYCVSDPANSKVCILKDNTLRYYSYTDSECFPDKEVFDLSIYGTIRDIATDPNNNFYFIITELEGVHKLRILNRKTLKEVRDSIDGINEIVHMSHPTGKLLCMDTDGYLRIIQINTNAIPRWYVDTNELTIDTNKSSIIKIQDASRHALAEALKWWDISVDSSLLAGWIQNSTDLYDDRALTDQIWNVPIGKSTLRELFDTATSIEDIETVSRAFQQIARNPTVAQVTGVLTPIEKIIHEKRSSLLIEDFARELAQIRANLALVSDFSAFISLQGALADMKQRRSQISSVNSTLDDGIRTLTREISDRIKEYQAHHQDQIAADIDANLGKIGYYLDNIDYMTWLTSVYNLDVWENTELQITYLPVNTQDIYRAKMHNLVKTRQWVLQKMLDSEKVSEEARIKRKTHEIEGLISQIEDIIWSIDNEKSLSDIERTDTLVTRIRTECELLQPSQKDRLLLTLDGVFRDRTRDIRLANFDKKWVSHTLDEYGLDTGLYYSERGHKNISYTIWGKRTSSGTIRLELRISNGAEHLYDFDAYLTNPESFASVLRWKLASGIAPEMSQTDFIDLQRQLSGWKQSGKSKLEELKQDLSHAHSDRDEAKQKEVVGAIKELKNRYRKARFADLLVNNITSEKEITPRPYLQPVNARFIVLDEERDIIRKISDGMMIQKETGKGIDILEWSPWLGKTEIVRFIAGMTNREIIRVQCAKMDPSDMFFSPQLKAGETSRQPAGWIQLMQKPGTVVLFDEIDKLSTECFDRLHSLFDGWRSVYDAQIGSFQAHKDAVFLGTRNSYERMTNPITSRGTIIIMEPPGEVNEAFKVSKYTNIAYFEKMNFPEFQKQYARYTTSANTTDPNEKMVVNLFGYIRSLVKTLNALRTKQKSEDYNDKFEYELSYRDAEQIFLRFNRNPGVSFKNKVKEVLVPKVRAVVRSPEDKDMQEKIANEVIDLSF